MAAHWTSDELWVLRDALGLTQKDFAKEIGVAVSTARKWEKGQGEPSTKTLPQLARLREIAEQEEVQYFYFTDAFERMLAGYSELWSDSRQSAVLSDLISHIRVMGPKMAHLTDLQLWTIADVLHALDSMIRLATFGPDLDEDLTKFEWFEIENDDPGFPLASDDRTIAQWLHAYYPLKTIETIRGEIIETYQFEVEKVLPLDLAELARLCQSGWSIEMTATGAQSAPGEAIAIELRSPETEQTLNRIFPGRDVHYYSREMPSAI